MSLAIYHGYLRQIRKKVLVWKSVPRDLISLANVLLQLQSRASCMENLDTGQSAFLCLVQPQWHGHNHTPPGLHHCQSPLTGKMYLLIWKCSFFLVFWLVSKKIITKKKLSYFWTIYLIWVSQLNTFTPLCINLSGSTNTIIIII